MTIVFQTGHSVAHYVCLLASFTQLKGSFNVVVVVVVCLLTLHDFFYKNGEQTVAVGLLLLLLYLLLLTFGPIPYACLNVLFKLAQKIGAAYLVMCFSSWK